MERTRERTFRSKSSNALSSLHWICSPLQLWKETRYPPLQRGRLLGIADGTVAIEIIEGTGVVEKAHAGASWGVLHRIMTAAPRHRRTCSCSSTRRHAFPIDFRSGHDVVFGRRHDLMGIAHQPFLVVGHCRVGLFRSRNSLVSLGERGSSSNPLYSAAFARYCSAVNMLTILFDQARARRLSATDALCWVIRTVINCIWGRWRRSAIFIFDEQSYGAAFLSNSIQTPSINERMLLRDQAVDLMQGEV